MTRQTARSPHPDLVREAAAARIARLVRTETSDGDVDPNHHLWRNGRLWWIAFTVHFGHRQERLRFSLGTADVETARRRRDEVLWIYEQAEACRIAIRLRPRPFATARDQVRS